MRSNVYESAAAELVDESCSEALGKVVVCGFHGGVGLHWQKSHIFGQGFPKAKIDSFLLKGAWWVEGKLVAFRGENRRFRQDDDAYFVVETNQSCHAKI